MPSSLLFTGLLASYIASETFSLGVERLIIKDPVLPEAFHNLRVVFLSDIHHGRYSSRRRLARLVKKINSLGSDLILLGGDYLQDDRNKMRQKRDLAELLEILGALTPPPLGVFAVLGNHDYAWSRRYWREQLSAAGIGLLHNQHVRLERAGGAIFLLGVGDLWFGQPDLGWTTAGVPSESFKLLVSHQPNFIDELTEADGINFVFAGHTHAAQVSLFHYMPIYPKKIARWQYSSGLVETPQTRMLVSPGIGTVAPYFRFAAAPKIHLLTFKAAPRLKNI